MLEKNEILLVPRNYSGWCARIASNLTGHFSNEQKPLNLSMMGQLQIVQAKERILRRKVRKAEQVFPAVIDWLKTLEFRTRIRDNQAEYTILCETLDYLQNKVLNPARDKRVHAKAAEDRLRVISQCLVAYRLFVISPRVSPSCPLSD